MIKQIQRKWGRLPGVKIPEHTPRNTGEVVILHYNGLAPVKIDSYFEISYGKGWVYVNNSKPKGEDKKQVEQAKALARSIAANQLDALNNRSR